MMDEEEDYTNEEDWTPTEEEIQDAIEFFDKAVPDAAGLLNAKVVESDNDETEHDHEIVQARIQHLALAITAGYDPDLFLTLLEQVGSFRIFERELEAQGSPTRLTLQGEGRARGCDRHSTVKLDGYKVAIEGGRSFDAYDWVGISEELRIYPDMEPAYKLATRAEKYFRQHLAGKLLSVLRQLLFESVYAARGEVVSASKVDELEKITSTINKCPELKSRKAGRPVGSGTPVEEKDRRRRVFEQEIEDAIRRLRAELDTMPTKTRVAQELKIGGRSPFTGNDTSLSTFIGKLRRLDVNYEEIVRRVELNE